MLGTNPENFFNLPLDLILHAQVIEHERGGHTIIDYTIIDSKGQRLHSWANKSDNNFLLDQSILYYVKRKDSPDRKYNQLFCTLNLTTMTITEQNLNLALGINASHLRRAKLFVQDNNGVLAIRYKFSDDSQFINKQIPFSELLKMTPEDFPPHSQD